MAATILLLVAFHQIAVGAHPSLAEPISSTQPPGRPVAGFFRIASVLAGGLTIIAAYVVAASGEVVSNDRLDQRTLTTATWMICAYLAINALTDLASASATKRLVGSGAKAVAALLCAIVASQPS